MVKVNSQDYALLCHLISRYSHKQALGKKLAPTLEIYDRFATVRHKGVFSFLKARNEILGNTDSALTNIAED